MSFSAGTETKVFDYPMRRPDGTAYTLKVAPLICYEDTVPALAREATRKGAELLVNLTSDSWFGRTPALHQHHLIAAFRAIEMTSEGENRDRRVAFKLDSGDAVVLDSAHPLVVVRTDGEATGQSILDGHCKIS